MKLSEWGKVSGKKEIKQKTDGGGGKGERRKKSKERKRRG